MSLKPSKSLPYTNACIFIGGYGYLTWLPVLQGKHFKEGKVYSDLREGTEGGKGRSGIVVFVRNMVLSAQHTTGTV